MDTANNKPRLACLPEQGSPLLIVRLLPFPFKAIQQMRFPMYDAPNVPQTEHHIP